MPAFCAAFNCGNRSNRDRKSFFRLPANPKRATEERKYLIVLRRLKWLLALRRADLNETKIQYLRVCGDHFITGRPASLYDTEHPDWVPSIKMGYETNLDEPKPKRFKRKTPKCEVDSNTSSFDEATREDNTFSEPATLQKKEHPDRIPSKNKTNRILYKPIIHRFERQKHKSEADTDSPSSDEATGENDPISKPATLQETKYQSWLQCLLSTNKEYEKKN